jgi:hypothetical protein
VLQVSETTQNLVTLKIKESDREWLIDEQQRLRKVERKEPSHHEIFTRLRRAYQAALDLAAGREPEEIAESPKLEFLRKLLEKDTKDLSDIEMMMRNILDDYLRRATMPEWQREQEREARRKRGL